ncbi:MAG: response regulator [Gammaproteobacteria bacterium]|nr:response regulator [Gammaproteobacteria bacterium]MBT6478656.1 response regulator [Gammaproteobacteria bacterium]
MISPLKRVKLPVLVLALILIPFLLIFVTHVIVIWSGAIESIGVEVRQSLIAKKEAIEYMAQNRLRVAARAIQGQANQSELRQAVSQSSGDEVIAQLQQWGKGGVGERMEVIAFYNHLSGEMVNVSTPLVSSEAILQASHCNADMLLDEGWELVSTTSPATTTLIYRANVAGVGVGRIIGRICAGVVLNNNLSILRSLMAVSGITGGALIHKGSILSYNWGNQYLDDRFNEPFFQQMAPYQVQQQDGMLVSLIPVKLTDKISTLTMAVVMPDSSFSHLRDNVSRNALAILLITLILVTVTVLLFRQIIVKAFNNLMHFAQSVKAGDLQSLYHKGAIFEYNQLGETLQLMVTQISAGREELLEVNKTMEEMLKTTLEAKKSAEAADRSKSEFLSNMSHELRTPLTSIIGNSGLLAEQEDDYQKLELIYSVEAAGKEQLELVNDILDMSKIESGKFTIDECPYDLSVLLHDIEHMFSFQTTDMGLSFVIHQENHEEYLLLGSGQRITQILINLVGNAIKFTDQGGITLTSSVEGKYLKFQIEDTGIGMSSKFMERLFHRFEQADGTITRRFGGSGLGLFISLNLAELMGGTIIASSQKGKGSTFELALPYKVTDIPVSHHNQSKARVKEIIHFEGTVLVAEDTPSLQMLIRRLLEKLGVTVTVVVNGQKAIEAALNDRFHFDLIFMDMQMPVMGGIEATTTLRSLGCLTPIIALTANVMEMHKKAFYDAGCDGYVAKPFNKGELVKTLQQYLAAEKVVNTGMLEVLQDNEGLMTMFMRELGRFRLELIEAMTKRDWLEVDNIAHSIKGSGSSFGYPVLTEKAKDVCDSYREESLEKIEGLTKIFLEELEKVLS